jgi:hypothetical protein
VKEDIGEMSKKFGKRELQNGRPAGAFAVVGDPSDAGTWLLPHHGEDIFKAIVGRVDIESTVDWDGMAAAMAAISPRRRGQERIATSPEAIIEAARHLAAHFEKAGRPLPDVLAVLI